MVDNKFLPKLSQNLLMTKNIMTLQLKILSTNKKKNDGTLVHIKLPNILPETFQIILRYIYGGKLSLEEYDASDIIKILVTASELSLQELIPHLQSFLIKNKANWLEQNFNLIYQTSFENDSFLKLQKYCTELMSKKPEKIFKSPDFTSISEKSLVSIIQHDNFQMSEVQVWEYALKWGLAQNQELPSDLTRFSKDNFNSLKNTLQQCVRFINFYNLTSKEFFSNVLPYKKILPKDLRENLLNHFLNPDVKKPETRETTEVKTETQIIEEIRYIHDKYKAPISADMEAEILQSVDFEQRTMTKELIPAETFALALKRFMLRFLTLENQKEMDPLWVYLRDSSLNFWPSTVPEDRIEELFPESLLVANTYDAYEFTMKKIEQTMRKQQASVARNQVINPIINHQIGPRRPTQSRRRKDRSTFDAL